MKVNGIPYKTIWMEGKAVMMIDQNLLPFTFSIKKCDHYQSTCLAIKEMTVRGAGAIGAAGGYAMAQALVAGEDPVRAKDTILATRPTARDLFYAVERVFQQGKLSMTAALLEADYIARENESAGKAIGEWGNRLIKQGDRILTHCNAGWLAFVDYGSALAPIYAAHRDAKDIFVYVDETRPRNQGARLTAWELSNQKVNHIIIPDNAGALLMAKGLIDLVITGADRIASNGDAANKIGTLEKAIVAGYFNVPFYIAAPTSTIDLNTATGKDIVIEERSPDEILWQSGPDEAGITHNVRVANPGSPAYNAAFDVTPASLIKGIITEYGIVEPGNLKEFLEIQQNITRS